MEIRLYEITFIIDSQLEQKQIDEIVQKIETMITDSKGEIVRKDIWGKRRLAYEINRKQYGFYVYLMFNATGDVIQEVERNLKLNESILRFLSVRLSKAAIQQMEKKSKKSKPVKEEAREPQKEPEKEKVSEVLEKEPEK